MIAVSSEFNISSSFTHAVALAVRDFSENQASRIRRGMMRPGHTALTREICWGRGESRALNLIGVGANDQEPADGIPPMIYAAWHDRYHAILALAGKGVDPNQEYDEGNTPLHYAVFMGRQEAVEALLTAGANPNKGNDLCLTPLQMAQWCAKDANASNLEGGELSMQHRSPIAAQLLAASERAAMESLVPQDALIPAYQ
jgi:ankyrin repeat protein